MIIRFLQLQIKAFEAGHGSASNASGEISRKLSFFQKGGWIIKNYVGKYCDNYA
jgi:hypothetical protein